MTDEQIADGVEQLGHYIERSSKSLTLQQADALRMAARMVAALRARDTGPPVGDWLSRVDGLLATLRGHFEAGLPQNAREAVVRFIGTCQDEWMTAPETRRRLEAAREMITEEGSHFSGCACVLCVVGFHLDAVLARPAAPPVESKCQGGRHVFIPGDGVCQCGAALLAMRANY